MESRYSPPIFTIRCRRVFTTEYARITPSGRMDSSGCGARPLPAMPSALIAAFRKISPLSSKSWRVSRLIPRKGSRLHAPEVRNGAGLSWLWLSKRIGSGSVNASPSMCVARRQVLMRDFHSAASSVLCRHRRLSPDLMPGRQYSRWKRAKNIDPCAFKVKLFQVCENVQPHQLRRPQRPSARGI